MDETFIANIPDIATWGKLRRKNRGTPRPYLYRGLTISVIPGSTQYLQAVHDMANLIACARLRGQYLELWQDAVSNKRRLSPADRAVIASALARGIKKAGSSYASGPPACNDIHFKGHVVEVLLYALRGYLLKKGIASPMAFEPPRPKAMSNTPGIDLLEVGSTSRGRYYFQVWECKGTDGGAEGSFKAAARQLCDPDETAFQSFMEAHRSLEAEVEQLGDSALSNFVAEMPRAFYSQTPDRATRVGGIVGSGSASTEAQAQAFAREVGGKVQGMVAHCQAVSVYITDFPQYRRDVYQRLWTI